MKRPLIGIQPKTRPTEQRRFIGWAAGGASRVPARALGYGAALLSTGIVTLAIGAAKTTIHVENLSLVYLLGVLWLAVAFGRGPAIVAALLAFLAYDYFFVPPLHHWSVSDVSGWISLVALLATALVLGQLTSAVQARARAARESQRQTATLYALAQLFAAQDTRSALGEAATERLVRVFDPFGLAVAALILAEHERHPVAIAVAPAAHPLAQVLRLDDRQQAAQALWTLECGEIVGGSITTPRLPPSAGCELFYIPLRSQQRIVGVLGVGGTHDLRRLLVGQPHPPLTDDVRTAGERTANTADADFFAAVCDQIAFALDRLRLHEQAIHAQALRESDQLKTTLLGSVTHDLRTPLASIKAAATSLLEPDMVWSDASRRAFLESIDESADRLNRLVGNLLDLSRLEAGVARPDKQWNMIGDVLATVLDRLDLTGQTRSRRVEVDLPDDLPLVPMDHTQIEQVLTNLLENALKYSPPASPVRVRARVSAAAPAIESGTGSAAALEVRVTDAGIGIPAGELTAIFDKFYRVQQVRLPWTEQRPPIGTGLGLAICAGVIHAHGGHIWAESPPGAGATFTFTLPIPAEQPHGALPELEAPGQADEPEGGMGGVELGGGRKRLV